jgi:hypothetical protein
MGKGRRNQRNVDYYKVQGGAIEDRDASRAAKQKLSRQKRRAAKRQVPDVHPATPRRIASPRARKPPPAKKSTTGRAIPEMPETLAGAALSRLGGLKRRVLSVAQSGMQVMRWAGHMIEVARGRKRTE